MSLFVNFDDLDPYTLFAAAVRRTRLAMCNAFDAAFKAYNDACSLLERHAYENIHDEHGVYELMGLEHVRKTPRMNPEALKQLHAQAVAEDRQADYQAAPVLLFADDALQRFAKGLLGRAPSVSAPGYGPEYRTNAGKVKLTRILRAGTNTIRHVSEWDDAGMPFPYPALGSLPAKSKWRQPMESIEIIQQVFGIGMHERIRDPVSMRILIRVDGVLGTGKPAYERFETAVLEAAFEIAAVKGEAATKLLREALG